VTEAQPLPRRALDSLTKYSSRLAQFSQMVAARVDRVRSLITVTFAVVILVLSWPITSAAPGTGLDASWVAALHVAAQRHLHFGSQLAYSFGPLGFIALPQPYFGWTSALAFVFVASLGLLACLAVVHMLRRAFPFWVALPLAYLIARPLSWIAGWDLVAVMAFIACVELLRRYGARNIPTWALVGLGLMAGLALLGKINVGITVALLTGLVALLGTTRRRPAILVFGAALVVAFLAAWLALGQSLWDIPRYTQYSIELALGYNQAMGLDFGPNADWVYFLGAVAIATVALAAYEATLDWQRLERIALVAIGLVMAFALFKTGFVRNRFTPFYVSAIAVLPVFAVRAYKGRMTLAVATLIAAVLVTSGGTLTGYVNPSPNIADAHLEIKSIVFHHSTSGADTAARMRQLYELPPEALAAIGDHTVQIEPFDAGVAYAYPELRWDPLPIFQTFSAYTSTLDEADAAALRSPTAPERILWLTPPGAALTIDGRSVLLEAPRTIVEMICRYVPIASSPSWQVLAQVPNRCGTPEPLASVTSKAGVPIAVPRESRADRLVVVHVSGIASGLGEKVQGLIFKTPAWWLRTETGVARLVPGTADGPLLLGGTGSVDYVEALNVGAPAAGVAVGTQLNGGNPARESSDTLTYDFYSIPISHAVP
jgi:hypothetical protein